MSNIVQLTVPSHPATRPARQADLMQCFATHRRIGDDVFWLKENAELLNILECTGASPGQEALCAHAGFYAGVEKRMEFFPQYYRFLLSIALDLEDLGMDGDTATMLVDMACDAGLAEVELSDLQRGEARRLMQRRGRDPMRRDAGLDDRLRGFIGRSGTFALPNKKAAYELTHIVFYLSEYGRRNPDLDGNALISLQNVGLLAFLDQNADLLAEVCVAQRHAGQTPPPIWENWLDRHTRGFEVECGDSAPVTDDYHEFLVCNWLHAMAGREAFAKPFSSGRMAFFRAAPPASALRHMSETLFEMGEARSGDWAGMRRAVEAGMSDDRLLVLDLAEQSTDRFEAFFHSFARAPRAVSNPHLQRLETL